MLEPPFKFAISVPDTLPPVQHGEPLNVTVPLIATPLWPSDADS